jgi:hypothetical protein
MKTTQAGGNSIKKDFVWTLAGGLFNHYAESKGKLGWRKIHSSEKLMTAISSTEMRNLYNA